MDEDRKIPLADIEQPEPEKNRFGPFKTIGFILAGLVLFFISPLPGIIVQKIIPASLTHKLFENIYQEIILSDTTSRLEEPLKYEHTSLLKVLGRNTGLCFIFNGNGIESQRIEKARKSRPVAEVIAMSKNRIEYTLDEVTVAEDAGETTICQKFGKDDSVLPDFIKAIYVRPLEPFTATQVMWATARDVR